MILIYIHGCNCGDKAKTIRRIKSFGRKNNIEVIALNSKYDKDVAFDHLNWLRLNGMGTDSFQPIAVENNNVVALSEWQSY